MRYDASFAVGELQRVDDGIEFGDRAHPLFQEFGLGQVIAADVGGFALLGGKRGDDFGFAGLQGVGDRGELLGKFGVVLLGGKGLGPVEGQVEV